MCVTLTMQTEAVIELTHYTLFFCVCLFLRVCLCVCVSAWMCHWLRGRHAVKCRDCVITSQQAVSPSSAPSSSSSAAAAAAAAVLFCFHGRVTGFFTLHAINITSSQWYFINVLNVLLGIVVAVCPVQCMISDRYNAYVRHHSMDTVNAPCTPL